MRLSSQPVAENGVAGREREERAGHRKKDEVEHGRLLNGARYLPRSAINAPFVRLGGRINAV
jgi:hypothetical protein